ncbi:MAG: hypothetical protein KA327_01475 [Pseudarcicella sp.]|nr:hypothetical protein [Pseudarcicella sp.]
MKNFSTIILVVIIAFSCNYEGNNIVNLKQNDASQRVAATAISSYDLAQNYAPIITQDVDVTGGICSNSSRTGSADWIAPVNYDGDWKGLNNWDNLTNGRSSGKLKGVLYYNTASTSTHWYILYSVFHPRDWTDFLCDLDSHENDMEGILVCASRGGINGQSFGAIEYVSTIFHTSNKNYKNSELLYKNGKIQMFIESKGHGIRKYESSSDQDGSHIEYALGINNLQPVGTTASYKLVSLLEIWNNRTQTDLFVDKKTFKGDNYKDNAANAPWAWGDICNYPANHIKTSFGLTNFDTFHTLREIKVEEL